MFDVRQHPGAADIRAAVLRVLKSVAQIDREAIDLRFVFRGTAGIAIAIIAGMAMHSVAVSVMAGVGALFVGVSSQPGVYRTRLAVMLISAAVLGLSAFAGSVADNNLPLLVALIAVWGFSYGMLPLLGLSGQLIGVYGAVTLVIASGFPAHPLDAALHASVYVAGGMIQVVLLILEWPLRRFTTERRALARACRALGAYAHEIPFVKLAAPDPALYTAAGDTLADPHPLASAAEARAFRATFDAIGAIRARLAALTTDRYVLESYGCETTIDAILAMTSTSATLLFEIADALQAGRPPAAMLEVWHALDDAVDRLGAPELAGAQTAAGASLQDTIADARAFAKEVRDLYRLACDPRREWNPVTLSRPVTQSALQSARSALTVLRNNFRWSSPYFKHGLRLAIITGVAMLAGHLLPFHRPYWVPLTTLLILRPDYGTTFTRGISRVAGTVVGALLIFTLITFVTPGTVEREALIVAFAALMYTFAFSNYFITAFAMTVIAISMVGMIGLPEGIAISERVGATFFAVALALAGYLAFPAWTHRHLRASIANLLDHQREYLTRVLGAHAEGTRAQARAVLDAERNVRNMRANVDTTLAQMLNEPVRPGDIGVRTAIGIVTTSRRVGILTLALRARIGETPAFPAVAPLASEVAVAMQILASALRERTAPDAFPALARAQAQLAHIVEREARIASHRGIVMKTGLLVESLYAIAEMLER